MARGKIIVSKDELRTALECEPSARSACLSLGLAYTTFIRRCKEFGIYVTNQGLKGTHKSAKWKEIPLEKIFSGEHLMFGQALKKKLISAGLIEDKCSECNSLPEWKGKKLVMQLDHIDGDRLNNTLENVRLLCPNCHSQTPTFSKGKRRMK